MESGVLVVKSFGAQKIYCVKQDTSLVSGVESGSSDALKSQLNESNCALIAVKAQLESINAQLFQFDQYAAACTRKSAFEKKLKSLREQVANIESSRSDVPAVTSSSSADELLAKIECMQRELSKRKRIATEMISVISEQCGMTRAEVTEDLGLETIS